MAVRVAINGFGRIGRNILRAIVESGRTDIEVVAVNDLGPVETNAHLLRYDSVHGKFPHEVTVSGDSISVGGKPFKVTAVKNPAELPHKDLGVDIVLECTGIFTSKEKASAHLAAGAKKVIVSAPADGADFTVVYGINHDKLSKDHIVISNGSCTTNCLAPMAMIMNELVGIEKGMMTTIHSYTGDQPTLDTMHKDLYRARAAALSQIPTSTGAAKAIGLVLPQLQGKVDGISVRAPVPTGSITDLVVRLGREVSIEEINDAYRDAAGGGRLEGILRYADDPLVSTDIIHSQYSCIVDSELTMANGTMAKVFGWYDNEWGYSCRLVDVVSKIAADIPASVAA
jgi:glyceraldehyde 3-phosphate dehydrogenase